MIILEYGPSLLKMSQNIINVSFVQRIEILDLLKLILIVENLFFVIRYDIPQLIGVLHLIPTNIVNQRQPINDLLVYKVLYRYIKLLKISSLLINDLHVDLDYNGLFTLDPRAVVPLLPREDTLEPDSAALAEVVQPLVLNAAVR